ncbi:MAG: GDSL-type esterase/lipase family protein [Planctomycetota bacterium]
MRERPRVIDAEEHYWERMRVFEAEVVEPGGIVLVGSSHFEWFDTDRFLPGRRIVNRGIASDRLGITERGILHRLEVSVFNVRPAMIVFNNGVNDLGELWRNGEPPEAEIYAAYERAIAAIRAGSPGVPLLIVNELPTTGDFAGVNPYVPGLNAHISRVAERHGGDHLDFHSEVVGADGELRVELTYDGLHLNDEGYGLLAARLEGYWGGRED